MVANSLTSMELSGYASYCLRIAAACVESLETPRYSSALRSSSTSMPPEPSASNLSNAAAKGSTPPEISSARPTKGN